MTNCPGAETLAAFAEGRLSAGERAAVLAHLDECEDCMATLEALNETIATRPRAAAAEVVPLRPRHTWWLAAAAAVIIGIGALWFVVREQRSPMSRLVALMPASARPVEPRLSGGFPWAAYHGPVRAEDAESDPRRMQLIGTAGEIVAAADRDRTVDAQKAAGVALIVIDQPSAAIDRLRAAVQASPNDAEAWSDLAAAQYAAASRMSRPSLLPEALVSADRALKIDARNVEARFNRALILERLGLLEQARAEWKRYLAIDATSPWASEARARLAKLEAAKPASSNAQKMRTFAEAETLARWADAFGRGDAAAAERELRAAREVGDTLARTSGESLLREAVRAIDASADRRTLAEAHLVYRRGRIAYSKRELDAALADLTRATTLFGRSPMALVARYYAASVRFDRNEVDEARSELEVLLREARAHPQFLALGAQVRWELALPLMVDGDWSGALPLLEQSRDTFRKLDERNHLGFLETLVADTLVSLGRLDEAWAARSRAFTLLSTDGGGDRMVVSLTTTARYEVRAGRLANARALLDAAYDAAAAANDAAIRADALVHSALVNVALDDAAAAERSLREGTAAADRIRDPAARELARADLDLAGAAVVSRSDTKRAKAMLARAIDGYRAADRTIYLPECYLLRARASLREGDAAAAAADLESGIEMLERSRIRTGAVVGTGVLNAGVALFEEAIRLSAERGDVERAFEYAERSRAQLVLDQRAPRIRLRDLQQSLAGTDSAVLEVVSLPEQFVTICVTARGASMAKRASALDEARLYDAIIRPFDSLLRNSRELIVVADRSLQKVPFAALYDSATKRHLVERMAVTTAMSASALRPMQYGTPQSLLAVTLPSGQENAGLPESTREVTEVSALYVHAIAIAPERATFAAFAGAAPDANVIHIAGHTQTQSDDAGTALLFAQDRVTWTSIAMRSLPRAPVVVLAACETLRPGAVPNVRSMTLGDGFLAAGATDVVGTLTPIADADARELFQSIHRHLAAGDVPAQAVRAAQLEALSRHSDAWRAITSRTRCINANTARRS